jgi:ABC-type transport system substrate-binding protein
MNKRTLYYTSAVAAPLLALGFIAAPVFAQGVAQSPRAERPEFSAEQKAALKQARELHKQGKHDEAIALLESAGLPDRPMMGRRMPGQVPPEMREHRADVREAVLNGDYAAFQELTKDAPFASKIDEATFNTLHEAAKLREAGDLEGAKALLDEAGIKPPRPEVRPGMRQGMKNGMRFQKGVRAEQK